MKNLPGIQYLLESRGLTEDTIRTFSLGYCDSFGITYVDADFTGVLPTLDKRFYESSVFPIQDLYGRVIGVSVRPLKQTPNSPKYINTVYDKACHLYGLHVTWKECLAQKKVYVVEGNLDTLMMYQSGIRNVVGMLGSNFTPTQLCLLSRFVNEIVLVPDGDKAGINFFNRMQKNLTKKFQNFDVQFKTISLPIGYDPDKFLRTYPKDDLLALERELSSLERL